MLKKPKSFYDEKTNLVDEGSALDTIYLNFTKVFDNFY